MSCEFVRDGVGKGWMREGVCERKTRQPSNYIFIVRVLTSSCGRNACRIASVKTYPMLLPLLLLCSFLCLCFAPFLSVLCSFLRLCLGPRLRYLQSLHKQLLLR